MKIHHLLFLILLLLVKISASAQSQRVWQGKQCAVVLTYDDALNVHLDQAVPVLDSLGLKATFYLAFFRVSGNGWRTGNLWLPGGMS